MKPLTGLPPSVYLQTAEQGKIPLADLLQLVQALEAGNSPAYLARYRPDLAAGCNELDIVALQERLRSFLDLEDRRVLVLSAIGQAGELTPALRETLESTCDRNQIEDIYTRFKAKRRMPAEEAAECGLTPLADFLWAQEPPGADPETEAAKYVSPDQGVPDAAAALDGARHIMARRISDCAEIRPELRGIALAEARIAVKPGEKHPKDEHRKKLDEWAKNAPRASKIGWRQMLAIRRAVRDGWASYEIALPDESLAAHVKAKLLRSAGSAFEQNLGAAANLACKDYLAATLVHDVELALNDRVDAQAVEVVQEALERLLMTPGAGAIPVIGLETGRSGGWRAAVIDAGGNYVIGGALGRPMQERRAEPEESVSAAVPAPDSVEKLEAPAAESSPPSGEAASGDGPEVAPAAAVEASEPPTESTTRVEAEQAPAQSAGVAPSATGAGPEESDSADEDASAAEESGSGESEAEDSAGSGAQAEQGEEQPEVSVAERRTALAELIKRYRPAAIAYANGPQSREIERFIRSAVRESGVEGVFWAPVNDAASWIYATSKVGRKDLPRIDSAVRSAATLARRLRDPLSEFVKIEGRPVGIGPFHHEIEPRRLRAGLRAATEECVHRAGVDLNTASIVMLAMVPGITDRVAKRIVEYRKKKGKFPNRQALRKVPGLSERIYEQAAGFVRVHGGENPLDASGIHPHAYPVVEKILAAAGVTATQALEKPESLDAVDLARLQDRNFSLVRLQAIVREFREDVRDPREKFKPPTVAVELRGSDAIKVGAVVEGVITNVTKFGVFVDIGGDSDGLVHLSQLPLNASKDIESAFNVGDSVTVRIVALEEDGKRISLSMRDPREAARPSREPGGDRSRSPREGGDRREGRRDGRKDGRGDSRFGGGPRDAGERRRGPQRERTAANYTFGPDKKEKEREIRESQNLPIEDKLALLASKFRTKV